MSTSIRRSLIAAAALAAAAPALAAPRVAVDIAPVHAIAASVMAGVGTPTLIVPPGASEHDYALRPSEAAALEAAELVVWVGPSLTPWLEDPLDALAGAAPRLTLQDAAGMRLLPIRDGGPFEPHAHDAHAEHGAAHAEHAHEAAGHAEDHAEDHAGDHAGHDHDAAGHAEDHAEAAAAGAGHADHAAGPDPHIWLDPRNASAIAAALAEALARQDPANADAYAANAAAFAGDMAALEAEIAAAIAPLRDRRYVVFHDAYQYFEDRFGAPVVGSVALSDAETPNAPRVAEIRDRLAAEAVDCIFAEPQFPPKLIATLIEGTATRTGSLDPLGAGLEPGPALYPALLRALAADLRACLDAT